MVSSKPKLALSLCFASLTLSSCFVQHRIVKQPGTRPDRPPLTATKEQLIERIHAASDAIQSFNMRADMSPSVGSLNGGALTDYATIRAYVLFRRPTDMRVIGLDPVVHSTTIFDMASTGEEYKVSLPSKNRFIIGDNSAPPDSKNKLENLRPSAFLNALIIAPPTTGEATMLEDDTDETKATYILFVPRQRRRPSSGPRRLLRPPHPGDHPPKNLRPQRQHRQRDQVLAGNNTAKSFSRQ